MLTLTTATGTLAILMLTNSVQIPPVSDTFPGLGEEPGEYLAPDGADEAGSEPPHPGDLLERLRAQFTIAVPDQPLVRQELDWYRRHPQYLNRVFARGARYLHHILGEAERRGIPVELALLPIVESAFDPFAYSHGRAAGLWQIIPGTGRRFGLEQNWWYDGRRDVIESTRAALDYLELLATHFDGDWLLAVAAYNSGEGNVFKAIRRNKAKGKPVDFWHLRLPKETRAYVPRFLALSKLVADPAGFGIALPAIRDEPRFVAVDIGGQLDLALAAELAGIDIDTLYTFNPAYNRWATAPDGPHRLAIPVEQAELFAERIRTLPAAERMRWQRHKVAPGETLSQIAERYSISISSIRSANQLRGSLIRAGQYLLVPASTKPLTAYSQSADQRLERIQNRERDGNRTVHVVSPGESFWTISRRYGVGVRSLASWNGMAPRDTLSIGRELVVWTRETVEVVPAMAAVGQLASNQQTRRISYTVRSGDNLSSIAARFRVRVADIVRWNKISLEAILRPGQRLTMYVDVMRQSS